MHVFILDDLYAANSGHINKTGKKLGSKEKIIYLRISWQGLEL